MQITTLGVRESSCTLLQHGSTHAWFHRAEAQRENRGISVSSVPKIRTDHWVGVCFLLRIQVHTVRLTRWVGTNPILIPNMSHGIKKKKKKTTDDTGPMAARMLYYLFCLHVFLRRGFQHRGQFRDQHHGQIPSELSCFRQRTQLMTALTINGPFAVTEIKALTLKMEP